MGIMDKVSIHHSTAYDFLAGIFRLNNRDKILEIKHELDSEGKIKLNDSIQKWIDDGINKMTEEMKGLLDLFFNYESFFGFCLVRYIADNNLRNIDDLINYVRGLAPAEILARFLETGYGDAVGLEQVEEMLGNHKTAVSYIEKNISLPSKQKWDLLQFFLNPDDMKAKLLQLFEWCHGNIFENEINAAEEVVIKHEKEVEKKLRMYGEDYLKLLLNLDQQSKLPEKPIIIALSYYHEISNSWSLEGNEKPDMYLIGYRYPELIAGGKHVLLSNVNMFKALADETRLNIIKLLYKRPWYGNELAQELRLSNSTISYHMSMLLLNGFVDVVREENRFYFSMDIEKVKAILCDALDKMVK